MTLYKYTARRCDLSTTTTTTTKWLPVLL